MGSRSSGRLLKKVGETWAPLQDDRPRPGSGQRFYLDGTIDGQCSLGCDGGDSCYEGGTAIALSTLEYVQIGLKPATSTQCSSDPTAAAGDIPDIVSRDTQGPYQLELTYMANACDFSKQQVVHLPVP